MDFEEEFLRKYKIEEHPLAGASTYLHKGRFISVPELKTVYYCDKAIKSADKMKTSNEFNEGYQRGVIEANELVINQILR